MASAATNTTPTRPGHARAASRVRTEAAVEPDVAAPWFERMGVILPIVFLVLVAGSLLKHPGGYLSTDTGPKVATVDAMAANGSARPVIGYWASEADPDGALHPFGHNLRPVRGERGSTDYVVVTTLPMLHVAQPLYQWGGLRLALLVPIAGSVATAAAAGALARRLGRSNGAAATWIVGVASPAAVYALDFWEHAPGLALMAWALVAAVDSAEPDGRWYPPLLAGLAFGAAAALRQEALIYGFVAGLALAVGLPRTVGLKASAQRLGLFVLGGVSPLVANAWVESAFIGETVRVERGLGALDAGGVSLGDRVVAGLTTLASPGSGPVVVVVVNVVWYAGSLAGLGYLLSRRRDPKPLAVVAGCAYLVLALNWVLHGGAFFSGLLVAAPLAGIGLGLRGASERSRMVWWVGVSALPLVMAFQYVQGAGPQWGGRYLLTSGFALTVVAVTGLEAHHRRSLLMAGALSVVITMAGVAWSVERSQAFGTAGLALAQRDEPLVFVDPFLPQEFGPVAVEGRWLAATNSSDREAVAGVLDALGHRTFSVVEVERGQDPLAFAGTRLRTETESLPLIGDDRLRVTTYEIER